MTRSHYSPKSHIDEFTPRFKNFLDLLPFPLSISLIVTVEPHAPHLHELHDHNTRKTAINNYNYQFAAECYKRLQELAISDEGLRRRVPAPMSSIFIVILESARHSMSRTWLVITLHWAVVVFSSPIAATTAEENPPLRSLCSPSRLDFIIHVVVIRHGQFFEAGENWWESLGFILYLGSFIVYLD